MTDLPRIFFLLTGAAWGAVLAWLSLTPSPPEAPLTGFRPDLVFHVVAHALFAFLIGRGTHRRVAVPLALGAAIGLEVAQLGIPGRTFDGWDLAANLIGAGAGLAAALRFWPPQRP